MGLTGNAALLLALVSASSDPHPSRGSTSGRVEINRKKMLAYLVGQTTHSVTQHLGRPHGVGEIELGVIRWTYIWGEDFISLEMRNGVMTAYAINPGQTAFIGEIAATP